MEAVEYLTLGVVVFYGFLLGLIAPYIIGRSEVHGGFVPTGLAITTGSLIWLVLTWFGLSYESVWIWLAVMLITPAVMFPAVLKIRQLREAQDELELRSL